MEINLLSDTQTRPTPAMREAASAKLVSRGLAALREGYRDDVR